LFDWGSLWQMRYTKLRLRRVFGRSMLIFRLMFRFVQQKLAYSLIYVVFISV